MYNIEPYVGDRASQDFMKSLPASQFIGATVFFLPFKQALTSTFSYLFGENIEKTEGEFEDFSIEGQFSKRWGWFSALHTLAKGNATKFREATKINIYDACTWLSYEKDRADVEKRIMKRNRK